MAERGPNTRPKLEIVEIIGRLEALTSSATKLPLTRRAVINPKEVQELVTQLRNALPSDINEAMQVIRYRDTIINQAQTDATRMRNKAEEESMVKVSESHIVKDAQVKAKQIIAEVNEQQEQVMRDAENAAENKLSGADNYALEVLTRLDEEMNALLQTTRRGIESLREGKVLED